MAGPVILDTDMVSEILRGRNPQVEANRAAYAALFGKFTFTSVTAMEILYGLRRKDATAQILIAERLFARNQEIVPKGPDYRLAAQIMSELEKRGTPIGPYDPLIAACAINVNFGVATGNTRHFGFVQAAGFPLRLEDWRQP